MPDNPDLTFDLPNNATEEQKAFKTKLDAAVEQLKKKKDGPERAAVIAKLRAIADLAFKAVSPDVTAATTQLQELNATIDQLPDPPVVSQPIGRIGAFEVELPDPNNTADQGISWREIIFNVTGNVIPTPADQLKLKADIETTLTTLQAIFPDEETDKKPVHPTPAQRCYSQYQAKLVGIARTGLQTPADPESSRLWLSSLQSEILLREGPRIKNDYMRKLGMTAAAFAAISFIAYLVIHNNQQFSHHLTAYRNIFILWTGTMAGAWLSFGIRRPDFGFKDLIAPENDMVEPAIRLIFTGLIAVTLSFIFICGMVNVNIGALSSSHILNSGATAVLIGLLFGVSEQALPGALTKRASQFVNDVAGRS